MSSTRAILGLAILTAGAGCASSSGAGTVAAVPMAGVSGNVARVDEADPTSLVFAKASVQDVWKLLPGAFATLRIPGGVMDEAGRVFGNQKVVVSTIAGQPIRDLFRCSVESGLSISDYRIEFGITAQPHPSPKGGTELIIQTSAIGRFMSPSRSGTTHCVTNGLLEQKLHRQLQLELLKIGK